MHWLLVLLGLVAVVLTVVLNDQLITSWAEGRPDMRRVLETQGLQAVKDGPVRPPAFVAPAITLYVVVALLMWMLLVFFANGNNWARLSLTALLFFTAVTTVAGIRTEPARRCSWCSRSRRWCSRWSRWPICGTPTPTGS